MDKFERGKFVVAPSEAKKTIRREITNADGVSSQPSLPPVGRWGFAESRKIRVLSKSVSVYFASLGFAGSRVP